MWVPAVIRLRLLVAVNLGGPMGFCPLLIYKDNNAALSPKMGPGRTYPPPGYITTPAAEDV